MRPGFLSGAYLLFSGFMINKITTRKNPLIKERAALNGSSSQRNAQGCYIAEGARLVEDAAKSKVKIKELYYTESAYKKYRKYIDTAAQVSDNIYVVEEHVADLLSSTKSSQDVFAVCEFGENLNAKSLSGRVLTLENIQDPLNMGTILRTAEALGIGEILLVGECCDVLSPKVLRASMGAVFRIRFIHSSDAKDARELLDKHEYTLLGAVPLNSASRITDIKFNDKISVAIGNEGNGLTEKMKSLCDDLVTIPMKGRAESLNAATSASIIMWEMTKGD